MNKIILTDVDGVLVNWNSSFENFMKNLGFELKNNSCYLLSDRFGIKEEQIKELYNEFQNGTRIKHLEPIFDAPLYVKKIFKEFGYRLVCVTHIGSSPSICDNRVNNLLGIYGNAIQDVICLDRSISKKETLNKYFLKDRIWVEDYIPNAIIGDSMGLKTFLLNYEYNQYEIPQTIRRVDGWSEIYKYIKQND
jgi:hypothetical protein